MFHHNWVKATGRVLDSRHRTKSDRFEPDPSLIPLHSYIVEFRAPNGETNRLQVEQHIETVDVSIGSDVPLLVSPDGKKAVFDKKDPRINANAVHERRVEADEERFRKQLDG